jgi:hypothetical protein
VSLAVWVPSAIVSLSLLATAILVILWMIPAPEQGDLVARMAGYESNATADEGREPIVLGIISAVSIALWLLVSLGIALFGGRGRAFLLLSWLVIFTAPIRWWHGIASRFATIPLAISGGLLAILWFVGAVITTASRDGWGSWLFLWMVVPLFAVLAALGTGLFSRWGANQYGSYLLAFGSIWMVVLVPIVWLWAIAGLVVSLLPIAPLVLGAMTLYGDFGFAGVVENIPLDSFWAPLALQPFPAFWMLGLVFAGFYWIPASVSWLVAGHTASRGDVRARTVLLDTARLIYTFPIGPRDK